MKRKQKQKRYNNDKKASMKTKTKNDISIMQCLTVSVCNAVDCVCSNDCLASLASSPLAALSPCRPATSRVVSSCADVAKIAECNQKCLSKGK